MDEIRGEAEQKINEEASKVKAGFEKARQQASSYAEKAAADSEDALKQARARGKKMWRETRAKGEEVYDEALLKGEEGIATARSFIQRNPAWAIGLAVGILAIIGALLFYRSSEE